MNKVSLTPHLARLSLVALLAAGCSSVPKDYHDPEHVGYQNADHNFLVWVSPDFHLDPARDIQVPLPGSTVVGPANTVEIERAAWQLRTYVVQALNNRLHRPTARAVSSPDRRPDDPDCFWFELTIADHNPGHRSTSVFPLVGATGVAHPSILIRGSLIDTASAEPVFRFVAKRGFSGREAGASWTGDEDPMTAYLKSAAVDLADLVERARDGRSLARR